YTLARAKITGFISSSHPGCATMLARRLWALSNPCPRSLAQEVCELVHPVRRSTHFGNLVCSPALCARLLKGLLHLGLGLDELVHVVDLKLAEDLAEEVDPIHRRGRYGVRARRLEKEREVLLPGGPPEPCRGSDRSRFVVGN